MAVYLVSMSPQHRALLAIQLGWCPYVQDGFGDSHEESSQVNLHVKLFVLLLLVCTSITRISRLKRSWCDEDCTIQKDPKRKQLHIKCIKKLKTGPILVMHFGT
jgi:hypothetical protein